jgi:hypothetical protein
MSGTDGPALDVSCWAPNVRRLYDYWRAIHPSGALPGRQHFDPSALPDLLPGIWLLDVYRDPFRLKYRLAGSEIVAAIGREVTGMWIEEAHPHVGYDQPALQRYLHVVLAKRPSWRTGTPNFWSHRNFSRIENLLLPLAKDGETVDMIMAYTILYRTGRKA